MKRKRPQAKPNTIEEWASQYPEAKVTRAELVSVLEHFALVWASPQSVEKFGEQIPQPDGDP